MFTHVIMVGHHYSGTKLQSRLPFRTGTRPPSLYKPWSSDLHLWQLYIQGLQHGIAWLSIPDPYYG